jgi:hypothetical protein
MDKLGNSYISADGTEVVVHGAGHNAATVHSHKKNKDYEYEDDGLSSSQAGRVYPTKANTKNIVNHANNRKTIGN